MRIPGLRVAPVPLDVLVAVVVLAAGLTAGTLALSGGPDRPASRTTPAAPVAVGAPAAGRMSVARAVGSLAILHDWDRARARAWSAGRPAALRALYVAGSRAGERDVAKLRAWTDRGLRGRGMGMQVLAVELRRRTADRLVLVVTDRLGAARAVVSGGGESGAGAGVALPRDTASTRRLVLRRTGGEWRMASVRELPTP